MQYMEVLYHRALLCVYLWGVVAERQVVVDWFSTKAYIPLYNSGSVTQYIAAPFFPRRASGTSFFFTLASSGGSMLLYAVPVTQRFGATTVLSSGRDHRGYEC